MKAKFKTGAVAAYGSNLVTIVKVEWCNYTNQFVYNVIWKEVNAFGDFIGCQARNVEERILR